MINVVRVDKTHGGRRRDVCNDWSQAKSTNEAIMIDVAFRVWRNTRYLIDHGITDTLRSPTLISSSSILNEGLVMIEETKGVPSPSR